MTPDSYIAEIERRLKMHFSAARDGYKLPAADRHRLEGFMQGAIFMGLATRSELAEVMESVHYAVFGMSLSERKIEQPARWQESEVDYSGYDAPAYQRTNR